MKTVIKHVTVFGIMIAFVLVGMGVAEAGGGKGLKNMPTITMQLHAGDKAKKEYKHKDKSDAEKGKCQGKTDGCQCQSLETITVDINDVVTFHGHLCPGSALGYRACQVAFAHLYPGEIPPRGDQFIVSSSTRGCPNDAISFITGARYGKGSGVSFNNNLAFDKTLGEDMIFIVASMSSGKTVKLVSTFEWPEKFREMKKKAKEGDAEAKESVKHMTRCLSQKVLTAPESDVFTVTPMADFSWKEYKEKYLN